MNKVLAPIVVFAYNRPEHVLQCLKSIQKNDLASQSTLYIFCDGPKPNSSETDLAKIIETRKNVKKEQWCKEVIVIEHAGNKGLAACVSEGVTDVVNKHETVIVLEDDLVVSKYFLEYMNEALSVYKTSENVYSISGFMFSIPCQEKATFLLPYISTWGWATWKKKWATFNPKIEQADIDLIRYNLQLKTRFNLADYNYAEMLDLKENSWGISWYYSVFVRNGLSVFPAVTLVKNTGNDGSGTNYVNKYVTGDFDENNRVQVNFETTINLKQLVCYESLFSEKKRNKFKSAIDKFSGR